MGTGEHAEHRNRCDVGAGQICRQHTNVADMAWQVAVDIEIMREHDHLSSQ